MASGLPEWFHGWRPFYCKTKYSASLEALTSNLSVPYDAAKRKRPSDSRPANRGLPMQSEFTRMEKNSGDIVFKFVFVSLFNLAASQLPPPFAAITTLQIPHCPCSQWASSLVRYGAFTSTPTRPPKWAFDLQLLEFINQHFLYSTPDITAWCKATVAFLLSRHVEFPPSAVRSLLLVLCTVIYRNTHAGCPPTAAFCSFARVSANQASYTKLGQQPCILHDWSFTDSYGAQLDWHGTSPQNVQSPDANFGR